MEEKKESDTHSLEEGEEEIINEEPGAQEREENVEMESTGEAEEKSIAEPKKNCCNII